MTAALLTYNILVIVEEMKIDRKKVELTDGTITLRPFRDSDAEEMYQAINESLEQLIAFMAWAHRGYSFKEYRTWVKRGQDEWNKGRAYEFVILDAKDGRVIGACGLNEVDKGNRRCNLGYWVRTSRTKRGVATAATRLLAKWGFDVLKLTRIEILIAVDNAASLRVAEKAGAKREGVLRNRIVVRDKTYDAAMHSLIPGEV